MSRIEAKWRNARAVRFRFSQSLASLRQRFNQAIDLSTIQRFGRITKPFARSDRFTISMWRLGKIAPIAVAKIVPLIGAVGEQLFEKRKAAEQRRKQQHTAVAILNTGRMNYGDEQQASCVYENMSFFALDFLACVEPVRIDRDPPFSALFTL